VFDPSITILRITCTSSTALEPSIFAIRKADSIASMLGGWGGSSSASTRHADSGFPLVEVDPPLVELEDGCGVDLAELALSRAEPSLEGEGQVLGLHDGTGAEELGAVASLLWISIPTLSWLETGSNGSVGLAVGLANRTLPSLDRPGRDLAARFSCMTRFVSSADFVFASDHISFARAVSGSMSSSGTTPAFCSPFPCRRRSCPPDPIALRGHAHDAAVAENFFTSSMFLELMCPNPVPSKTTPRNPEPRIEPR